MNQSFVGDLTYFSLVFPAEVDLVDNLTCISLVIIGEQGFIGDLT